VTGRNELERRSGQPAADGVVVGVGRNAAQAVAAARNVELEIVLGGVLEEEPVGSVTPCSLRQFR
jgi:hypothetical protein